MIGLITKGDTVRIAAGIDRGRVATVTAEIPLDTCEAPGPVHYKYKINHGGAWIVPSVILADLSGRALGRYPVNGLDRVTLATFENHPREDRNATYMRAFQRDPETGLICRNGA